jgi:hypothetical protein
MSNAKAQRKTAMRVSAIRFGADLWRLLEEEASRVGVSVSQYVREAALARASAAAAARGENALEVLAGTAHVRGKDGNSATAPRDATSTGPVLSSARSIRSQAQATRSDAQAVRAQSQQASRRAHELARKKRSSSPPSTPGEQDTDRGHRGR